MPHGSAGGQFATWSNCADPGSRSRRRPQRGPGARPEGYVVAIASALARLLRLRDPLANVRELEDVDVVIKGGEVVKRD